MELDKLQTFLDWMERSPLSVLEVSDGDFSLRLVRRDSSFQNTSGLSSPKGVDDDAIKAPSFGVVHLAPTPEAVPFISEGARVEVGQTLGLIEAMKVFSPITAEQAGKVAAILVEDGSEVAAGDALFRIVKNDV